MDVTNRIERQTLAREVEKMGLITSRQKERVEQGLSVNVNGKSVYPAQLEIMMREL